MANNVVKIDFAKVNKAGDEIIAQGNKMFTSLTNIQGIINNGKKSFDSEGGEAIRKNFNTSAQKFDEFKKFVAEYGQFLQNYNEVQKRINDEIQQVASQIPKL